MQHLIFKIVTITLFVGLFYFKKFKNTIYIYFILFLFFTFIVELINAINYEYLLKHNKNLINTSFFYNIYLVFSFPFIFLFYRKLFKKQKNKKISLIFTIMYLSFCFYDFVIKGASFYSDSFNTNAVIFGSILILIMLILFLIEIINNKQIIFNITKSVVFWISVGLLLFYIGIVPIMITKMYLNYNELYFSILNTLNAFMYGSFIIGFIKSDPKYNY